MEGRARGARGAGTTKSKVAISLETDQAGRPRFARMHVIDQVSIVEIQRAAQDGIAEGSTITSDGHSSYKRLPELGYTHFAQDYYKADPDFLKWVHTLIANAKAFINGTYHGLQATHLQAYLDEFCYRFNRRFFPNELFGRLLNACLSAVPDPVPEQSA